MELISLIFFASLFVISGIKHIRNHAAMVSYTTTVMGSCPVAAQVGYLGGWPTGVFLAVFGAGVIVNRNPVFAYGLAVFLALATVLFHRDLKDPMTQKTIALLGAALFIASHAT